MQYLHSEQIAFRELKPQNIGFTAYGSVNFFDFGCAERIGIEKDERIRIENDDDEYNQFSSSGGTPRYNSPKLDFERPHGDATDVFSFSILESETMSLKVPYQGLESV